jgi:hypothetical protein
MEESDSMTSGLKILFITGALCLPAFSQTTVKDAVLKVDEEYRTAKLQNDTAALLRILADSFVETNQNGDTRNKAQIVDLWSSFRISTLTTDSVNVSITGENAVLTGTQTENGDDRMLFMRVYMTDANGWRLLASMQSTVPQSK